MAWVSVILVFGCKNKSYNNWYKIVQFIEIYQIKLISSLNIWKFQIHLKTILQYHTIVFFHKNIHKK